MNTSTQECPHPLAHIRHSRGWSYQDLARVVAENARALGVPMAARREKVWRWEHWGVVPEPDSQRALARALGVPEQELRDRPWPRWLPVPDGVPSGLAWTAAGSVAALHALLAGGRAAEDVRGYPLVTGRTLQDAIADWAGATPTAVRQLTSHLGDRVTDEPTVAWLESGVLGLRHLDDRLGGAAVRHRVEADLGIVTDLLRHGARDRTVHGRLFRVAADLAQLGGWAAADTGRHAAAQRHFLTGLRAAHTARDRGLAVNLLAGLSLESALAGRARDALTAADAAARASAGASPRLRALVATRRARALALLGDEIGCRQALEQAGLLLAADRGPAEPWLYWFDAAELAAQSGVALLQLGQAGPAVELLDRALATQDRTMVRDRCLYLAHAGRAKALLGDVPGARACATEAGHLATALPSSPRLTEALAALEARLTRLTGERPTDHPDPG